MIKGAALFLNEFGVRVEDDERFYNDAESREDWPVSAPVEGGVCEARAYSGAIIRSAEKCRNSLHVVSVN
jgi:hypothetical protein